MHEPSTDPYGATLLPSIDRCIRCSLHSDPIVAVWWSREASNRSRYRWTSWPSSVLSSWFDTIYLREQKKGILRRRAETNQLTDITQNECIVHRDMNVDLLVEFVRRYSSRKERLCSIRKRTLMFLPKYLSNGIRTEPLADVFSLGVAHLNYRWESWAASTSTPTSSTHRFDEWNTTSDVYRWTYSVSPSRLDLWYSDAIGNLSQTNVIMLNIDRSLTSSRR